MDLFFVTQSATSDIFIEMFQISETYNNSEIYYHFLVESFNVQLISTSFSCFLKVFLCSRFFLRFPLRLCTGTPPLTDKSSCKDL